MPPRGDPGMGFPANASRDGGNGMDMEKAVAQSSETSANAELTAEEKAQLNLLMGAFNRLSIACKSRSLYPAEHPTAIEALRTLHEVLNDTLDRLPHIKISVGKDSLVWGDRIIGEKKESLRQLASRIRSLKIRDLVIEQDVTFSEVEALVELLISDPEELDAAGGAEAFLTAKGARNVGVVESAARLAGEETTPEGGCEAEAAGEEGEGYMPSVGKESKLVEGATIVPEKADRETLDIDVSDEDKEFFELLLDPESLARHLRGLGEKEGLSVAEEELADAIFKFLKDASQRVGLIYPGLSQSCFRSMAEALLFLDTGLRNQVLLRQMIPKLGMDHLCASILGSLNDQETADILSYFFPAALELVPKTRALLKAIGHEERDSERIIALMRNRLIELGEVPPSLIATLEKEPEGKGEVNVAAHELPAVDLISDFFNQYLPEEIAEIQRISELDLKTQTLRETYPILLDLMEQGAKLDNMDRAMELLEQGFWEIVNSAQLDMAAKILERIMSIMEMDDPVIDVLRPELKRLVDEATSNKLIHHITRLAYERREDTETTEGLLRYVSGLGEKGIVAMIEALGSEEDMSCRKYMIDILAVLCENHVHVLGTFINDPRWYLVRNIVTIMARLHSPDTIPYLRIALLHPNPKVRAETIRSLGLIGGYEASNILLSNLRNMDETTRAACIRWLGKLGEGRAVSHLINMLEDKEPGAESPYIKKEILISLAEIGDPETYEVLKKYCTKKKLLNRSEWSEINEVSRQALDQLLKKYPHLRR